ncbi:hypothetical protein PT974_03732 [Cladobotryum mycophilum]|uniref:Uncharacterized protein n=1 Tax=Cladobotryum mycophilum TaxID=491253 RepID=A0ABR0ST87_9HYPO
MDLRPRSFANSDTTTYHSFNDIELLEPPMSPPTTSHGRSPMSEYKVDHSPPIAMKMQRQDSGYESHFSSGSPRNSVTHSHMPPARRLSITSHAATTTSAAANNASLTRTRTRPVTRRSTGSQSSIAYPAAAPAPAPARNSTTVAPQQMTLFQFPSPDLVELTETNQEPANPPLPQTTHYWTSDSTRRLEYAAIDAASRGFKGWVRRHLLPDCFVGKEKHLAFDDDSGSVRRYRLDLADEPCEKFASGPNATTRPLRRGRLFFWRMRKSHTF